MKVCSQCKKEKDLDDFYRRKDGSYRPDCKRCLLDLQTNRWKLRKLKAVELFGGKCTICGYAKNLAAFDFHHIDPEEKEFIWKELQKKPWDQVITELKKCTLLCRNCHAEIHNPKLDMQLIQEKADNDSVVKSLDNANFRSICKTGNCLHCNKEVFGTKYCSTKCTKLAQRKVERPTKEMLSKELSEMSWTAIGRKYGVSDNAVRKWAKHYEII